MQSVYDVYELSDGGAVAEFPDGTGRMLKPGEIAALKAAPSVRRMARQSLKVTINGVPRVFTSVTVVQGGQAVVDAYKPPSVTPPPTSPRVGSFDAAAAADVLNDGDALEGVRVWLGNK